MPTTPNQSRATALLEISRSLVVSLDLQTVLQAAVDGVERLAGLGTSAIYLLDGDRMRLWATTPPLPADFPEHLRLAPLADHPHVAQALASHQPVLLPDQLEAQLTPAETEVICSRDLRTLLFLPLEAGSRAVGVLIVGSVGSPRPVSPEDVDLCRTLANLAALAVANAQLFRSVQEQAAELRRTLEERQRAEEARERLQAQLLHAQKMESIGRLAGGVAHDFNNMLQVILSYTELSSGAAGSDLQPAEAMVEIRAAAQRSADLTRKLLAFARRQAAEPRIIDLNDTVSGMSTILRRLLGEAIVLSWQPGAGVGEILMDPSQVEQILANLCVNSRDAIADTGTITVSTAVTVVDDTHTARPEGALPGEYCVLAVADDGTGMEPEVLAQLFEPFFTTKPVGKGTGLGMATVYGIVQQNRGFVEVESQPGKGTTVRIHLPRQAPSPAPEEVEAGPDLPAPRGETVLLVEDEPSILGLVTTLLTREGYSVLTADQPHEAIRLAQEHQGPIHLLVTDVIMPGMNGRDLAEHVTRLRPGLRCLFMSGYTSEVVGHHGVLSPNVDFIPKPFTLAALASKVRELLHRSE